MKRLALPLLFVGVLAQCGVTYDSLEPISGEQNLQLILFSTPWCEPCEVLLPQLDAAMNSDAGLTRNTTSQLFIVTGAKASQKPTPEIAAQYKDKLHLSFETAPDPWKWTTYKKYYGAAGVRVPGAVVLNDTGEVIKTFPPGDFDANEVVAFLKSAK